MKVIIELIEDIQNNPNVNEAFRLSALGLIQEQDNVFEPLWKSYIVHYVLDDENKKLYLFLGKENPLHVSKFFTTLNGLKNEQMMYEIIISYSKEENRIDAPLIGFGESIDTQEYLLFIESI